MAVLIMAEANPHMFHDFLGGMSCEDKKRAATAAAAAAAESGGHGLASWGSDLGSERQGMANSEVFHFHGRKNAISEPEASNTFSGRKRSNSDSDFIGLRDRMLSLAPDSPESFRLMKMIGKEVVSERQGRSHDEEMMFSTQLPPRPTSSLILHPAASSRPDSLLSKWERSMPVNPGTMVHYPTRLGQSGTFMDRLSSSYSQRDASTGGTLFSQAAADEGSRTGIKGTGTWGVANPSSGAIERYSTAVLPYSNRPRVPPTNDPESTTIPCRNSMASTTRQMTIFYAGQAHVFDDVHPNKADVIMALAGSNGGSWSTTYAPNKSNVHPPSEVKPPSRGNSLPLVIHGNSDGGLRQAAGNPVTADPPILIPESLQVGRAAADARLTTPTVEPDREGARNLS